MSHRARNGHRADDALDDATVEQLLAGRYEGDAADLVAVSELLGQVRSFAEHPAPPPSASLAQILSDSPPATGGDLRTTSRRVLRDRHVAPFRRSAQGPQPANAARHRWGLSHPPTVAAAVVAVLAAIVVGAGSARLLPGPTQNVVASIVRNMTPFDFPEQRKPETVSSKTPSPGTASPSAEPTVRVPGDSSQPGTGASETNGSQGVPGDGTSSRSQPTGVNPAPTPATTVAPASGPISDGVISPVPSPPRERRGFSADLIGAMGAESAGDLDGGGHAALDAHPGRDELCMTLVVSGLAPVTAVHLHAQSTGASGPVVAAWTETTGGGSAVCVPVADQLIKKIRKQPGNYYVDVHTTEFPNGAVRGPLRK
jgi:hypothetical protein